MGQPAHHAGQVIFARHLPRDKFCQKNLSDPETVHHYHIIFQSSCIERAGSREESDVINFTYEFNFSMRESS